MAISFRYTVLSIAPAPTGSRLVYANPAVEGGIEFFPCYFLAVCDQEAWWTGKDGASKPSGEPQRVVLPLDLGWEGGFVCDEDDDYMGLLLPGEELNENEIGVAAAREGARLRQMG